MVTNTSDEKVKPTGIKKIVNKLQKPDQLHKVTQYKRGLMKRYQSTKAMLKTTMQSQFDGVILAMNCLQPDEESTDEMTDTTSFPPFDFCVQEIPKDYRKNSRCVTDLQNMKRLFAMPENVRMTKQWISDGKLLHAHQCLVDLENFRDDYLYELHKFDQYAVKMTQMETCLKETETLSQLLEDQLKLSLSRILDIVREDPQKGPVIIETVFRIIEKEESSDAIALKRQRRSGFLPPGRPKKWREMAFKEFDKIVQQRLNRIEVGECSTDKMWLAKHLENCREFILSDLQMIESLSGLQYGPCFPLSYDMLNKFTQMYHRHLSDHLEELISKGLEGNEFILILSWIKSTYFSPDLLGHPDLHIDISALGPLLKSDRIHELQLNYLDIMEKSFEEWLFNILEIVKQDWKSDVHPNETAVCSQSDTPVIIFKMIQEYLDVTKKIGDDLSQGALALGMDQVRNFGDMYYEAIVEFKEAHFKDRNCVPFFTHHMITILNNCLKFQELADDMKKLHLNSDNSELDIFDYEEFSTFFAELRNEATFYLLEEAFMDLENYFHDLISTKWLSSTLSVDIICITLEDYFQDYIHLTKPNLEYVIYKVEDMVVIRYIKEILQKKIKFRTLEDRQEAAAKMIRDVDQLRKLFSRMLQGINNRSNPPLETIPVLAEVLKTEDVDIITLDLHVLVDRFPDITDDHLTRLLSFRGDLSKSEIKNKLSYIREHAIASKIPEENSVFSQIF